MRALVAIPAVLFASIVGMAGSTPRAYAQSEPFVGQTMIFAGNFCPQGWEVADGRLLPISENDVLFNLIGTTYGGDGQVTFALPDLRGRVPTGDGSAAGLPSHTMGERGGATSFTLSVNQMPPHTHVAQATNVTADRTGPLNKYLGLSTNSQFHVGPPNGLMAADMVDTAGGSQPISHRGPYLGLKMCISLFGVYPTQ